MGLEVFHTVIKLDCQPMFVPLKNGDGAMRDFRGYHLLESESSILSALIVS